MLRTAQKVRVRVRLIAGRQWDPEEGETLWQVTGTIGTAQHAFGRMAADPRYQAREAWILVEPLIRRPAWVMDALCAGTSRARARP